MPCSATPRAWPMGPHRSGELSLTDGALVFIGTRIWPCRPVFVQEVLFLMAS
jgi:hypothetical protein